MPSADLSRAVEVGVKARVRTTASRASPPSASSCTSRSAEKYEERYSDADGQAPRRRIALDRPPMSGPAGELPSGATRSLPVEDAVSKGAKLLCGGDRPDSPRLVLPPPLSCRGLTPDMRMYRDEVFGPVTSMFRVEFDRRRHRHRQ